MPPTPPTIEDILEHVNDYIAEGTTEDAISRLKELQEELAVTMETLKSDLRRSARAAEREDNDETDSDAE